MNEQRRVHVLHGGNELFLKAASYQHLLKSYDRILFRRPEVD